MAKPKDRDILLALATVLAAVALPASNASACIDYWLFSSGGKDGIERCRDDITTDTEELNQANQWLAHLEADAKTKPYLDPDERSQLQQAKNDVAEKSSRLERDKRDLDEMEHPKPPPPPPTPEEQAKAQQAAQAALWAEQEQRRLAACNNKPTSLGVLFCRWGR